MPWEGSELTVLRILMLICVPFLKPHKASVWWAPPHTSGPFAFLLWVPGIIDIEMKDTM